ncbi:DUF4350 domain-containing protein [Lapillicoccus sp.]|uniref:DUF4350 domain-containing protein n=1 Tax=Lapillicoccus sp. TaxID=1909287 RepID=UPI0025DE0D41|nr:DUF4350 domain-containing protein [Lapillicoccus sp.]
MDDGRGLVTTSLWDRAPEAGDAVPGAAGDVAADAARRRPSRRRLVRWAVIVAVVIGVALVMTWRGADAASDVPLDPRNPQPTGSQALGRVLADHGVEVTVARGQAALSGAQIDGDTTVFVARTSALAQATIDELADLSRQAGRVVVVDPDPWVLRYLSPEVTIAQTRRDGADLAASCDTADIRQGERISHSQSEFQLRDGSPTDACFTTTGHSVYLSVPATAHHAPLVLLGSRSAITNGEIASADNAAIALRTLGHSARLVWYVPSTDDIPTTDQSRAADLLPPSLVPGLVVVLMAVLGLMLWRGRRLGRLVREPLPVVIRAVETTESRGRIYRRAKDTGRVGVVLRDATRRRLAGYLGLPTAAPLPQLITAVSDASGRPAPEVGWLLAGPPPQTDDEMLGLAGSLAALEKEVRPS